jgi:hypothetical protein
VTTSRAIKALSLACLLAVSATACDKPAGTPFRTTVLQPDGSYPIPVLLGDQTGLVVAIESAVVEDPGGLPNVRPDPVDPNAVIVVWGTGACDDDVDVSFRRSSPGYRLDIEVHAGFTFGCSAQLLFRALRIRFSEAVPAATIAAHGGL